MSRSLTIPLDKIDVPPRQRSFDPIWAEALAEMYRTGQPVPPIGLSPAGDRWRLVFGYHRSEGAKIAGLVAIKAEEVKLDERDLDASAAWHEALENLMRRELTALDRMAHLSHAKAAHDTLYPEATRRGPKTRADEANWGIFPQLQFAKHIASETGFDDSLVRKLIKAYRNFSDRIVLRLQNSRLAGKQSELIALSKLGSHQLQSEVLDLLLADKPEAENVSDAVAIIEDRERPDPIQRKISRYAETLKGMDVAERDRIFDAAEEAVRDYAERKGWL